MVLTLRVEAPVDTEFLSLLRISEFFGFQWQKLAEILSLFKMYNNLRKRTSSHGTKASAKTTSAEPCIGTRRAQQATGSIVTNPPPLSSGVEAGLSH